MQICDRMFCQNPYITYSSAYNGIFKIAYVKIMPHVSHIQKCAYIRNFAHMPHFCTCDRIFSAFYLSNIVLRPLNIFGSKRLLVFTIRR